MTSARHKMLAGELYDPFDPDLVAARELHATCVTVAPFRVEPSAPAP